MQTINDKVKAVNALEIIKQNKTYRNTNELKEIIQNISSDSNIMDGLPVFSGTRIPIYIIIDCIAEGMSMEQILKDYPGLDKNKIKTALKLAELLASLH